MRLRAREIRVGDVFIAPIKRYTIAKIVPDVSSAKSKRPMLTFTCSDRATFTVRPDTWFEVERRQPKGTRRNAGGRFFTPEHDGLDSIRELLL